MGLLMGIPAVLIDGRGSFGAVSAKLKARSNVSEKQGLGSRRTV